MLVPCKAICPNCGETLKVLVRRVDGVEYVDLYCTFCEWRDDDSRGGS